MNMCAAISTWRRYRVRHGDVYGAQVCAERSWLHRPTDRGTRRGREKERPPERKGGKRGKKGLRLKKQVSACQTILNYVDGTNSKLSSSIAALAASGTTSEAKQALEEQYQRERYAMLLVYGAIAEPMSEKSQGSAISNFVRTFILPACDTRGVTLAFPDWKVKQNPLVAANALWALGRFASSLPNTQVALEALDSALTLMSYKDPSEEIIPGSR